MEIDKIKGKISSILRFFKSKINPKRLRLEKGEYVDTLGNTVNIVRFNSIKFGVTGMNLNYRILDRNHDGTIRAIIRDGGPMIRVNENGDCFLSYGGGYYEGKSEKGVFSLYEISPKWKGLFIKKININQYGGVSFECDLMEGFFQRPEWIKIL